MKQEPAITWDKPVLDEDSFQRLLAAACMLQQHNASRLVNLPKADCGSLSAKAVPQNVRSSQVTAPSPELKSGPVLPPEPVLAAAQADASSEVATQIHEKSRLIRSDQPRTPSLRLRNRWRTRRLLVVVREFAERRLWKRRTYNRHGAQRRSSAVGTGSHKIFWRTATAVAPTAVLSLLLGASFHRLSPLPGGLTLSSEGVQQQVPFQRTQSRVMLLSAPKTMVEPNRHRSSEADLVAKDTVVRYKARSVTPRVQGQNKPVGQPLPTRETLAFAQKAIAKPTLVRFANGMMAEDTLVRYNPGSASTGKAK